jgi:two-component system sensor histidine kinase BaeS
MVLMKTFFSKIMLAQVIAVVLALLVVAVITRVSLNRGFRDFLHTQETAVLEAVAPVLGDVYESRGNWRSLRNNSQNWQRIWRSSRAQQGAGPPGNPRQRPGPPRNKHKPGLPPPDSTGLSPMRWMRPSDRGMLRERLFLLDQDRKRVAGAVITSSEGMQLQAIEVNEEVVGWIGFTPMGKELPPEAQRFFQGQVRISLLSLALALVVAAALAFMLARNLSRPIRRLDDTVRKLSQGHYDSRASVDSRDEIGRLAAHVNQLAATLEQNRTARQRWMADIAHELRTPVAILKGEIEALADGIRPADERMSRSLHEEVEQLSVLIDDLQTLALSDAGALNINKETVKLDQLRLQCAGSFRKRLEQRGIELGVQAQSLELTADPQRVRQLLQNLLENSCRYVVDGGKVYLRLKAVAGGCELELEDTGPGLEDAQLEQLFERFYRVEESRSRSGGGTGLGLSICKNIVEAHGGQIYARHSSLGGLKIHVDIPG